MASFYLVMLDRDVRKARFGRVSARHPADGQSRR
jgi:hypothetical protein